MLPQDITSDLMKNMIEELSVYYVALTRAKKQVYVSASKMRTSKNSKEIHGGYSCFVNLPGIKLVKADL